MQNKPKLGIISCSVLQAELEKLQKQKALKGKLIFVDKRFHVDFNLLETNLRKVIQHNLPLFPSGIVLVYGDLCLGMNGEMKKLADEYGIVKVDALNCVDCLLGGKGKFSEVDPNHELVFLYPGMIDFFADFKKKAQKENWGSGVMKRLFSGLKGIVLLDTLYQQQQEKEKIAELDTGLEILEVREIGLENLKQVLFEAINQIEEERKSKQMA